MSSPALPAHGSWLARLVLALATTAILSTSTNSQSRLVQSTGGSRLISPAVIAAWSAHADPSGAAILDFLVLLRGEPGWFMGGESRVFGLSRQALDESPPPPSVTHMSYGTHDVKLRFDPAELTLTIQDEIVSLQAVNVVLVDGIDWADGVRVENVFWVDPQLPDLEPSSIESLMRKEPAIFPFLRCEARLEDAAAQRMFDASCDRLGPR